MNGKALLNPRGFTLMELMIITAIIGLLMAIAIPNYIAYRNNAYCNQTERDADKISGAISDYYSIPSHTGLPTPEDLDIETMNPYAVTGDPNQTIFIIITDRTGRCPDAYQRASDNWDADSDAFTAYITKSN